MELNAEQIKKALECCPSATLSDCEHCPYKGGGPCFNVLIKNALALIKELTEENERLNKYLDEHFPKCIYQYDGDVQEYCVLGPCGQFKTVAEFQKQIEADTVRKMQDKVRKKIKKTDWLNGRAVYLKIDKIAKEMLEDKPCT